MIYNFCEFLREFALEEGDCSGYFILGFVFYRLRKRLLVFELFYTESDLSFLLIVRRYCSGFLDVFRFFEGFEEVSSIIRR